MLFLFPFSAQAAGVKCDDPPAPVVKVTVTEDDLSLDSMQSSEQLAQSGVAQKSSWTQRDDVKVQGLSDGHIALDHDVGISYGTHEQSRMSCLRIREINVNLHMDPSVRIASDLSKDGCMMREIFEHEQKHIEEDRKLMHEFAPRIEEGLRLAFAAAGDYAAGPFPETNIDVVQRNLRESVARALQAVFTQMDTARLYEHSHVDSLVEYQRIVNEAGECAEKQDQGSAGEPSAE